MCLQSTRLPRAVTTMSLNTRSYALIVLFGLASVCSAETTLPSIPDPSNSTTLAPWCTEIPICIKIFIDDVEIPDNVTTLPVNKDVKVVAQIEEDYDFYYNVTYEWVFNGHDMKMGNNPVVHYSFQQSKVYEVIVRISAHRHDCNERPMMGVRFRRFAEPDQNGVIVSTTTDNAADDDLVDKFARKQYWWSQTTIRSPRTVSNPNHPMVYVILFVFVVCGLVCVFAVYALILWLVFHREIPFREWWNDFFGRPRYNHYASPYPYGEEASVQYHVARQMDQFGAMYRHHSADGNRMNNHNQESILICCQGKSPSACSLVDDHSRVGYEDLSKQDEMDIHWGAKAMQDNHNHHVSFGGALNGTKMSTSYQSPKSNTQLINLSQVEANSRYQGQSTEPAAASSVSTI